MQTQDEYYESNKREIGQKIKAIRLDLKLSQDGLADLMGTDRNQVYRHESGHNDMSVCTLLQYADALGVSPQELCPERYNPRTTSAALHKLLPALSQLNDDDIRIIQAMAEHLLKKQNSTQQN